MRRHLPRPVPDAIPGQGDLRARVVALARHWGQTPDGSLRTIPCDSSKGAAEGTGVTRPYYIRYAPLLHSEAGVKGAQLLAVLAIGFLQQIVHMELHGAFGDEQRGRNLGVAGFGEQKPHDLAFPQG